MYCRNQYASTFTTSANYDSNTGTWCGYQLEILDPVPPTGGSIDLFVGKTCQIDYDCSDVAGWDSQDTGVATVSNTGLVTAVGAGTTIIRAYDNSFNTVGGTYTVTVTEPSVVKIELTALPKTEYVAGQALDTSGMVVTVYYDSGDTKELQASSVTVEAEEEDLSLTNLTAGSHRILVKYQGFEARYVISVSERTVLSIECVDEKNVYEVGESFLGVKVRVNYNDGFSDIITSGYSVSPETAALGVTSYTVTYQGFTATRTGITVKETTGDYTLTYYSGPTKKTYTVGDTFDTTGLYIQVKNSGGYVVATLSGTSLVALPYTFVDSDITAPGRTTTISISVVYQNKIYTVAVPGLTVVPPKPALSIATQPASQEVEPGTPVSFTVSATGGTEPYTYQWQYLKPGAAAWVNVASASGKTKTYSLTALLRHNGYKYRCQITDADGTSVLSDEALLTVREPVDPLTVAAQPVDQTVTPGTTVSFSVTAEGGKAPYGYQWQYQKPGASGWSNVSAASGKTAVYTLKTELRHNGYTYRCRITDADGTAVLSDTALLTVADPLTVTFQPEDRTVLSGQSAPFVTAASGGVQPYSYRWQYMKPGTDTWTNVTSASGGDTSCFTVPKAAARHNGWVIRCRIRDAAGSEIYTNLVTLTVDSTSAPVLTQAPVGASATPGETVTFSVRAEGPGKLSYQWQYLKPGASAWVNVFSASGRRQDYSLKVEMRHNGYRYRVVVSSDNGTSTVSGAVYLDVWEEILGAGDMLNGFGSVGPAAEEDPDFGWDLPVLDLSEKEEALWDLGLITEADLLRPADEAE